MVALPKQYKFLSKEPAPRILLTGLATYGVTEAPGLPDNPTIIQWAKTAKLYSIYKKDSIAWCGLWLAYIALQSGWDIPASPLSAQSWRKFGAPAKTAMLGDVLVFWRESPKSWKGHVGLYVGEDKTHYHVLGGNQKDSVSFARIEKTRLLEARRCKWRISQPKNVRRVWLSATGVVTTNEA